MFGAHPMFRIGGAAGYQIPYSLRFRASNSANLSRTFGTPTDGKKFTLSWWMKRGTLTTVVSILSAISGTSNFSLQFSTQTGNGSGDFLRVANPNAGTTYLYTDTAIFRDPSAWYHFVFVFDSANATAGDRAILYVNGTRLSATVSVTLNATTRWNENSATGNIGFGRSGFGDVRDYYDGHMAEFHSIDGQALTPSSFGQTDATTGVWVPKKYSGTYGTNGFYLRFNDATTTTTIGNDSSGNSNNWTTSGISVTSGVTFDQMTDTPTLNYATWNFLDKNTSGTMQNANLRWGVGTGVGYTPARATMAIPASGKWYFEITHTANGASPAISVLGIASAAASLALNTTTSGEMRGIDQTNGNAVDGSTSTTYGAAGTAGNTYGVAIDMDAGTIKFSYNGDYANGSGSWNQTYGAGASAFTDLVSSGKTWFPYVYLIQSWADVNFGQRAFSYTPPSGFKALNTQNITSTAVSTSGSFTGNASTDGPFVWINGNPATLTINGNGVTFGTDADKTAGGFKLRTSSASYNASGTNNWTATAGKRFVQARKPNNAQVNP